MIDTLTAWSILCDPMTYVVGVLGGAGIAATIGWHGECQKRRWWKGAADHLAKEREAANQRARKYAIALEDALDRAIDAEGSRDAFRSFAIILQERIDREAAKRSSITSRGNLTKAAKRKAAIAATTSKLREELQAAQPAERLAA